MLTPRVVVLIFIVLVFGACAAVVVPLEQHYANDPVEKASRGEITGLHPLSMLRADNARRAIEEVRRRSPAEVGIQDLTIRPTTLSMTVEQPANGSKRSFQVDPGFGVQASEPSDASSDYGVTFRRIDGGVPERMARIVLDQVDRPEDAIDYATASISSSDSTIRWLLFLKGGRVRDRVWTADAEGSNVRRNGT